VLIEEAIFGLASLAVFTVVVGLAALELFLAAVGLVLEVLIGLFEPRKTSSSALANETGEQAQTATGAPKVPRRRWPRRLALGAGACLLLTVGTVLVLNFFFFQPTARWILARVHGRTGTDIRFGSASGNLLTGRLSLRDVSLRRPGHPATTFDLRADTFDVDLAVWSMVFGRRRVESAHVSGLTGTVRRVGEAPATPWFAKRSILIDQLTLDRADVRWADYTTGEATPTEWSLAVDELRGEGLSSRWLAFGLLFRTNATGRVNDRPFRVVNRRDGAVRLTEWRFEELPASAFGEFVGGPLRWVRQGHVDVKATSTWEDRAEGGRLAMDWSVDLRDVRAQVPAHLQGMPARLAAPFVEYVNAHGDHLPLAFTLELDRKGFDGAASPEAAGLWRALRDAAVKELGGPLLPPTAEAEELKRNVADRLLRFRRGATRPATSPGETAR
jgi:hypothetical protein